MQIKQITNNKTDYLELLLLADEQQDMVERYIDKGDMFALFKDGLKTVCVVLKIDEHTIEIKNLATYPEFQHQGYARKMINWVEDYYKNSFDTLLVGTGESPLTLPFYEKLGFEYSHRIKNFFTDNYDHPIFEQGIQLKDMIYLTKSI